MLFQLGRILATPGALELLAQSNETPDTFLRRHARGDWGELCDEDRALNDEAIVNGTRILSAYKTKKNEKLWIITEADRSATTCLLPSEY